MRDKWIILDPSLNDSGGATVTFLHIPPFGVLLPPTTKLRLQILVQTPASILSSPSRSFNTTLRSMRTHIHRHRVEVHLAVLQLLRHAESTSHILRMNDCVEPVRGVIGLRDDFRVFFERVQADAWSEGFLVEDPHLFTWLKDDCRLKGWHLVREVASQQKLGSFGLCILEDIDGVLCDSIGNSGVVWSRAALESFCEQCLELVCDAPMDEDTVGGKANLTVVQ